jgi:hypothetical protein
VLQQLCQLGSQGRAQHAAALIPRSVAAHKQRIPLHLLPRLLLLLLLLPLLVCRCAAGQG